MKTVQLLEWTFIFKACYTHTLRNVCVSSLMLYPLFPKLIHWHNTVKGSIFKHFVHIWAPDVDAFNSPSLEKWAHLSRAWSCRRDDAPNDRGTQEDYGQEQNAASGRIFSKPAWITESWHFRSGRNHQYYLIPNFYFTSKTQKDKLPSLKKWSNYIIKCNKISRL